MNNQEQFEVRRDVESPPGGWRYTPPETGVTIQAPFFRDLFYKVRQHLAANNKENPFREDVEDGACRETNPGGSWCGKRAPKPVEGKLPYLTLATAERFLRTIWYVFKERKLVPLEEAQRRIEICRGNEEKGIEPCELIGNIGGCASCHGLKAMLDKIMPKNPIPEDEEKKFCLACGCHAASKVWAPNKALDQAETKVPLYAPRCWRHKANRVDGY